MNKRKADRPGDATRPGRKPGPHPLIGSMKGTVVVSEGYDLTRPLWLDEMESAAKSDEGKGTE